MRSSMLVASLGIATIAACGSAGGETLLGGGGDAPGHFSDGGALPPGVDAAVVVDDAGNPVTSGSDSSAPPAPRADGGTTPPPPPPPQGAGLPCNVQAMLAAKCTSCHSDPPVNGSLSGLVTIGDLMATAREDPTKNEAQLSLIRMQSTTSPMPPANVNNPVTSAELAAFQSWVNGNYQGSCADAGPPPPPPTNVFTGAPGFVATVAGSTHNAGQNCMGGCHDHGFTFAGTLTDGQGNGVAGAEVRLVDANNNAISVHTGSNGNFHSSTPWAAPAHVGVRNATNVALMVTALQASNGGCNGCHATGGTVAKIHLP